MKRVFSNVKNKVQKAALAVGTAVTTLMVGGPVWATTGALDSTQFSTVTGDSIVQGVSKFLGKAGFFGGLIYAAIAAFTLVLAIRNEDNEGRNKAALNLVCAIILLGFGTILTFFLGSNANG